jgi:phosphoribosylanthranilate isomerase
MYAALQVDGPAALDGLANVSGFHRVLLDGPAAGSGTSFAWSLARQARRRFAGELFVAGGLTPENVAEAIRAAAPDGVDVASGIESPDGFKDPERVRAFVAAVLKADGGEPA